MPSFIIPQRFCGPPDSGNGGYTCGLLARELGGVVECTLRAPVPLHVPLQFERRETGGVLQHQKKVIVEGLAAAIDVAPPAPVSFEAASDRMSASAALDPCHPFPTCFVCGPQRQAGDGLRVFPAPFNGHLHVAAWVPAHEFGDSEHLLEPEFLWSAMDCPTGFAAGFPTAGKLVTGRLAVEQLKAIRTGVECVLMSWPLGVEGRKHFSAACLYQNDKLCAIARATWIRIES